MSRFIAVRHDFWMDSKGFEHVELDKAADLEHAEQIAAKMAYDHERTFNHAAVTVVEIGDRECLLPRRLTWRERLTGKLRPATQEQAE